MIASPLDFADDLSAFRLALREWLPASIPMNWRDRIRAGGEHAYLDVQREWYTALTAARLASAHWPKDWGGASLSFAAQIVYFEELAAADAPLADLYGISLYHMPATLFAHGTPSQRERYLEGARTGGEVWCQGFSEPGAGSDLASLRTRAERKGDVYVVNGQKIWSSLGVFADYCLLLARTDPDAPRKHDGISCFIVDMKTAGLTIRPIHQINAEAEFAEVFYDDVEIPAENLIGRENDGWRIAQSTLTTERGLLIFENCERLAHAYPRDAARGRDGWMRDPVNAAAFAAFYPRIRAMRLMVSQLLSELGENPHGGGEIATYIKLYWGVLLQDYSDFLTRMAGLDGQIEQEPLRCVGHNSGDDMYDFIKSFGWTIAGGSNEIMRNVIAERLLSLPK